MELLPRLRALLGADHVLTGADAAPACVDWRERWRGTARAVVRPGTTAEVAAVVRLCAEARVPLVPQGGNTSLCGAATPDASGTALVLSTRRLNRIRAIDTDNDTLVAEAGCVLQAVQEAARGAGRLFPLSLGAEGSCTIGGNLATNAGGTQVLRYGTMRELTLGLEVVTPAGAVWDGLRGLRKDNTGYALRDLYIGSEGTLGIITAATLHLHPRPAARSVALVALDSVGDAVRLLRRARAGFAAALTGFELMSRACLQAVARSFPEQQLPFHGPTANLPWYALLEMSDAESEAHAHELFTAVLGDAVTAGEVQDAVVASSLAQSRRLWHLRESIPLAEKDSGKALKHDISLPVSAMAAFVAETGAALQAAFPGIRHSIFGHLGDGNLHYNATGGPDWPETRLLAAQDEIAALVYRHVHAAGGSISAEHGIGQLKRDVLAADRGAVALGLMQAIKAALDPLGIMNPGKVLPAA